MESCRRCRACGEVAGFHKEVDIGDCLEDYLLRESRHGGREQIALEVPSHS